MGRAVTSGQLVSRAGNGDVPGPAADDCKGNVPLLAAETKKEISYPVPRHAGNPELEVEQPQMNAQEHMPAMEPNPDQPKVLQ